MNGKGKTIDFFSFIFRYHKRFCSGLPGKAKTLAKNILKPLLQISLRMKIMSRQGRTYQAA
jgi:hypothetical protein